MANYIILSPSKEMDASLGQQTAKKHDLTQAIQAKLKGLNRLEIAQLFQIQGDLLNQVETYFTKLDTDQAKSAYLTYQGLAFRQIDWSNLDLTYCDQHLRILSALYGPLKPSDPIHPYRLDLQVALTIQGKSLKALWRPIINNYFKGATIYNLASKEFSQLISSSDCEMIDIQFIKRTGKNLPSSTTKKLRGQLAQHLLLAQNFDPETFNDFASKVKADQFIIDSSLQTMTYVFDA
ncbi:YaaA family protein [Ignavigranum ruoffiae]|uniref:YaaA family protein n=1 Tax=Ignavigranum ruoffiae TaxID=89093 RepID=UPI00205ABCEC|nr:YaaA family protein [Ignavigranum ruoffiae]UPQ85007.1 YaaA family protein [Ignavigranum ruoffiae]